MEQRFWRHNSLLSLWGENKKDKNNTKQQKSPQILRLLDKTKTDDFQKGERNFGVKKKM